MPSSDMSKPENRHVEQTRSAFQPGSGLTGFGTSGPRFAGGFGQDFVDRVAAQMTLSPPPAQPDWDSLDSDVNVAPRASMFTATGPVLKTGRP